MVNSRRVLLLGFILIALPSLAFCLADPQGAGDEGVPALDLTRSAGSIVRTGTTETLLKPPYQPGEIIFKLKPRDSVQTERALGRLRNAHKLRSITGLYRNPWTIRRKTAFRADLPAGVSPWNAAEKMKADPDV